jgi:hypothetical protein
MINIILSIIFGFLIGSYIRKNHPTIDLSYGRMIDFLLILINYLITFLLLTVLQMVQQI